MMNAKKIKRTHKKNISLGNALEINWAINVCRCVHVRKVKEDIVVTHLAGIIGC